MQANPGVYRNLVDGLSKISKNEGLKALVKGWEPTCIGYHLQGMVKFGFNE